MSTAVAQRKDAPAELSPAQRQKNRLDQFMGAIEKRQDQIGTLLADSGIDPRLFLEGCRRSLMRDPDLIGVEPASFIQAALNCASDGLVPDGRKAAIVKFKGAAQYMPMYQGLLDVAYRSGQFRSIEAHAVMDGDDFDYEMGDNPFIRHKRPLGSTSTHIIGAYAIAKTINGGIFREVMTAAELAKVRAVSRAKSGPNIDWPGEMARKAPLRRMWKFLPKTPAMDRVAIHDDATYDHSALTAANEPTRQLRPGFNPPALTHQPADNAAPMAPSEMDDILDGDFVPTGDEPVDGDKARLPNGVVRGSEIKTDAEWAEILTEDLRKAAGTGDTAALQAIWGEATGLRNRLDKSAPERLAELEGVLQQCFLDAEDAAKGSAE